MDFCNDKLDFNWYEVSSVSDFRNDKFIDEPTKKKGRHMFTVMR